LARELNRHLAQAPLHFISGRAELHLARARSAGGRNRRLE